MKALFTVFVIVVIALILYRHLNPVANESTPIWTKINGELVNNNNQVDTNDYCQQITKTSGYTMTINHTCDFVDFDSLVRINADQQTEFWFNGQLVATNNNITVFAD